MTFWIIAAVVALVLFALAWWSSGRAGRAPGVNADGEKARGEAHNYDHGF